MDKPGRQAYIYGIDAVRFVCALCVAMFHFTYPRPQAVWMMPAGWIGVQIFFVISGLVIANSASGVTAGQFAASRALRLYPVAWIAAVLNFAVLLQVGPDAYRALNINVIPLPAAFFYSATLLPGYCLASAYWTLLIEITFYALVFGLLAFGGQPRLRLLARFLVGISTPYLLALFLHTRHVIDAPWLDLGYGWKNALLLRHGPYFALGIYIWLHKNARLGRVDLLAIAAALGAAGLEIFCRASSLMAVYAVGEGGPVTLPSLAWTASALFAVAVGAIWVSVRCNDRLVPPPPVRQILRTAGLMTYPFYLMHEALGGALLHALGNVAITFPQRVVVALLGVGAVAFVVAAWGEPLVRRQLKKLLPASSPTRSYS